MTNNVTVVIRSSNEQTLNWCKDIVAAQVPSSAIFVINEKPFSKAVKVNFDIGIRENKKWTLALDADVLITDNAISRMVAAAERMNEDVFFYQGHILDKLHGHFRGGGPHLYRTSTLKLASTFLEKSEVTLRPESGIQPFMREHKWFVYQSKEIYGLHDYFQSNRDYFRKGFFNAVKQSYKVKHLFSNAIDHLNDETFHYYLKGLTKGAIEGSAENVRTDIDYFHEILESESIDEHNSINSSIQPDVNKVIEEYKKNNPKFLKELLVYSNKKPPRKRFTKRWIKSKIKQVFGRTFQF